jgi:hypothetical protein
MRLVESSEPGAVERDNAIHLLTERAVLTRMVCFELVDIVHRRSVDRRVHTALSLLSAWVHENMPGSVRVEPHPADGINEMTIPAGYEKLVEEIRAGARVGEALFMYYTADTSYQPTKIGRAFRNGSLNTGLSTGYPSRPISKLQDEQPRSPGKHWIGSA